MMGENNERGGPEMSSRCGKKSVCVACQKIYNHRRLTYVKWPEFDANSKVVDALRAYAETQQGVCIMLCRKCRRNLQTTSVCVTCNSLVHKEQVHAIAHPANIGQKFMCTSCGTGKKRTESCSICSRVCLPHDMRKVCASMHGAGTKCEAECVRDTYVCRGCYRHMGASCMCSCCHRMFNAQAVLELDVDTYDFEDYNVAGALDDKCRKVVGDTEYICKLCHSCLVGSAEQFPAMPRQAVARKCDGAGEAFQRAIRQKPEFVCTCCHRWRFEKSVLRFESSKYNFEKDAVKIALADDMRHAMEVNVYKGEWCAHVHPVAHDIYDADIDEELEDVGGGADDMMSGSNSCARRVTVEYICVTCHRYLTRKKPVVPPMACANGLKLDDIPPELAELNEVERHVLALRIPFMSVYCTQVKGGQNKIYGGVTNVPTSLEQIVNMLPRMSSEVQYHPMQIKRKMCFKKSYVKGKIRKDVVMRALDWLMHNNPRYKEIVMNDDWFRDWEESELRNLVEEDIDTLQEEEINLQQVEEDMEESNETEVRRSEGAEQSDECNGYDARTEQEIEEDIQACEADELLHGIPESNTLEPECFENELYACAPGENQTPRYMLLDEYFEESAFPDMFPLGVGGYNSKAKRYSDLCFRQYAQQRVLNVDGRFGKVVDYLFCVQYAADVKQVLGNTYLALRLKRGKTLDGKTVTAGMMKNSEEVQRLARTDQAYKVLKTVRGSPPYWQHQLHEVLAMLRVLGKPTFFMTLSAADLLWREMLEATAIHKGEHLSYAEMRRMPMRERAERLKANPALAAVMFQYRLDSFITTYVKHPSNPLGKVTDHVCKIEFQQRGAPHAHCLLWVQDAPQIDVDTDEDVVAFIDEYISGTIPKGGANAKLIAAMVKKYQTHRHSKTCRKYHGCCRFDFPKPPSSRTLIAREYSGDGKKKKVLKAAAEVLARVHKEVDEGSGEENLDVILKRAGVSKDEYIDAISLCRSGRKVVLKREPGDACVNGYNAGLLRYWGANVDLQYVLDEHSTVMYICSYMMKSEKEMGEVLKAVGRECCAEPIRSQLKKIGKAFVGKRVVGAPEAATRLLSLPLIRKSRQARYIDANRQECRVSLPKPQYLLERMEDDAEDIYMTSWQDRYRCRPDDLENMCMADFAAGYDPVYKHKDITVRTEPDDGNGSNETVPEGDEDEPECVPENIITLKQSKGKMRKRKKDAIPLVKRYKEEIESEAYFHARLMLYKPWRDEAELLDGFTSYAEHYHHAQDEVEKNAKCHNLHEDAMQNALDMLAANGAPESVWDKMAPGERERNAFAEEAGSHVLRDTQGMDEQETNAFDLETQKGNDVAKKEDKHGLSQLYERIARKDTLEPGEYRRLVRSLNSKQRHIVMFNRKWFKGMVYQLKKKKHEKQGKMKRWWKDTIPYHTRQSSYDDGYRIFLSGSGGTGKSYVIKLIHHDVIRLLQAIACAEVDQPLVILGAPTGTAAFNIDGSTLHSAFQLDFGKKQHEGSIFDSARAHIMKNKLSELKLVVIDEVSMVGQKTFQDVSRKLDEVKGKQEIDWGGASVLAVGDLMQLNPIGQGTVYRDPKVNAPGDLAPRLWDDFIFHELDEVMRQRDGKFAQLLNSVRMKVPDEDSEEDMLLQSRELFCSYSDADYPHSALHVYARNEHCDNWNNTRLDALPGPVVECYARDRTRDANSNLMNVPFPKQRYLTGNLTECVRLKVGARVMLTSNIDVTDGLTNGAIGTVVHILNPRTASMLVLIKFDNEQVGLKARADGGFESRYPGAVPIARTQICFGFMGKKYIRVSRTQFPLMLAWAVTIHKVQGATLPAVVVDMAYSKGKFSPGQAYVAFSRVKQLEHLHILNYNRKQILVNEKAVREMQRQGKELLPPMEKPLASVADKTQNFILCHLNVRGLLSKIPDIATTCPDYLGADVICFNESKLDASVKLSPQQLGLGIECYKMFRCDRNRDGGGVMMLVRKELCPERIVIPTSRNFEHIIVRVTVLDKPIVICSVYKPPIARYSRWLKNLQRIVERFSADALCIVGDMNEDLLDEKYDGRYHIYNYLERSTFTQHVSGPTTDYGTLLDHVYTRNIVEETVHVEVEDCYYSDHDMVTCLISKTNKAVQLPDAKIKADMRSRDFTSNQGHCVFNYAQSTSPADTNVGGAGDVRCKRKRKLTAKLDSRYIAKRVKKHYGSVKEKPVPQMSHHTVPGNKRQRNKQVDYGAMEDSTEDIHARSSSQENISPATDMDCEIIHLQTVPPDAMPFTPLTLAQRVAICSNFGVPLNGGVELQYEGAGHMCTGRPQKCKTIEGDGSCLFRTFSYLLYGVESYHKMIRALICSYIVDSANWENIGMHIVEYGSGELYVKAAKMDVITPRATWGTDVEIFAFAQLCGKDVMVYNSDTGWQRFWCSRNGDSFTRHAMFLENEEQIHYNAVLGVV